MVLRGRTRLTRKGQITLPAAIRAALGLKEGDAIEVEYDPKTRTVTIEDSRSVVARTAGVFKSPVRYSLEEEKRASRETRAEYLAAKHAPAP